MWWAIVGLIAWTAAAILLLIVLWVSISRPHTDDTDSIPSVDPSDGSSTVGEGVVTLEGHGWLAPGLTPFRARITVNADDVIDVTQHPSGVSIVGLGCWPWRILVAETPPVVAALVAQATTIPDTPDNI